MSINNSKSSKSSANPYPMLTEIPEDANPSELNFTRTHEIFFSHNSGDDERKQYNDWIAFIRKCIGEDVYDSCTKFFLIITDENPIELCLSGSYGCEITGLIRHIFHTPTNLTVSLILTIELGTFKTVNLRTNWIFKEKSSDS